MCFLPAYVRRLSQHCDSKVIFFDAGVYIITTTVTIPAGCRLVGEAWSEISGTGDYFGDVENPKVMVRVGEPGSRGSIEITDIIFRYYISQIRNIPRV